MVKNRPFYLNLLQIRLPIGGWVSILHRASGVVLSLLTPVLLYVLALSLRSEADFQSVRAFFSSGLPLLLVFGVVWALAHHLLAGLRHLGFDVGLGEERDTAKKTAWLTLVLGFLIAVGVVYA